MKQSVTRLDMVRHGEVVTPGLLCAASDEALSDRGREQLAGLKSGGDWDLIISSPSLRCRKFAEQLAKERSIPLLVDSSWQEINLGEWMGLTTESIWKHDREKLQQLWNEPLQFTAPGGEKMTEFISRVQRASTRLFARHRGKSILLLTHAGVIRVIMSQTLEIDSKSIQRFNVGHGKINRLCAYADGEYSLLNWGCSPTEPA